MSDDFDNENEQEVPDFESEELLDEFFLNESVVSVELSNLRNICEHLKDTLPKMMQLLEASQTSENIKIVANCQKQTAEIANAIVERHALNPAIETVFILTNLLHQLAEKTKSLTGQYTTCHLFEPILNLISETAKMANDKCEYLGIEKISPDELDDFNAKEHEIKQPVTTNDSSKHKKIHQTLIPGLMYRGKVLKFAQVSVYCFKN